MKKVLIAHQSTIPHYRVDFYNALEAARPKSWSFDVVFDSSELYKKRFFKEEVDKGTFTFPTLETNTYFIKIGEKVFNLQTFWTKVPNYDLVIVGSALSNLTYPLCRIHRVNGRKFAIWGHGKDRTVANPSQLKKMLELFRSSLSKSADGFFAYTYPIKKYLETRGVISDNIYVLNNTIDIVKQRHFFEKHYPHKDQIKQRLGIEGKKVLLFVGRFTKNKRIEFLLEAFAELLAFDQDYHLIMVGSGSKAFYKFAPQQVTFYEAITDPDTLAPLYVASDLFTFPGDVGLGPLQALCYDLPVVTLESPTHMPEFVYLNKNNSIILPASATAKDYAATIKGLFSKTYELSQLKLGIWSSIHHLTIGQMANNFIAGVNAILHV